MNYKIEYDEKRKATLYKKGSKTKFNSDYVSIAPIEETYDRLMEIHVENNHNNGTDLYKFVSEHRLFSYPRDLVKKFPLYCEHCRAVTIKKEAEKKKDRNERHLDVEVDASEVVMKNLLEKQSIRRYEFYSIFDLTLSIIRVPFCKMHSVNRNLPTILFTPILYMYLPILIPWSHGYNREH